MADTIPVDELDEWVEKHALTGDEIRIVDTDVEPDDVVAVAEIKT